MQEFIAEFNFKERDVENLYFHMEKRQPIDFQFNVCKKQPLKFTVDSNFIFDVNN